MLALHIYTAEGRLGESGPCERKLAVLDNESDYTIEFGVCRSEDPASECHLKKGSACDQNDCSEIQGVGTITEALTDDTCKGTIEYLLGPDQKNTFTVSKNAQ